jgi:hypothetical protein
MSGPERPGAVAMALGTGKRGRRRRWHCGGRSIGAELQGRWSNWAASSLAFELTLSVLRVGGARRGCDREDT